jgi:hypothetical protein
MSRDLSQRVLRQGSPAPHLAYSRPIKSNAKPARTLTWRFGKPKLIAEAVLYSLFVLSPTKLFVGHCARPDTFTCASGCYSVARSVRSPHRARKDFE